MGSILQTSPNNFQTIEKKRGRRGGEGEISFTTAKRESFLI